jgi:signal transduction histidine kinase
VYRCIDIVHHIHYDFGVPALILVTLQVVLWSINYTYISPVKKVTMQMCFITAFQFLDVMPALNSLPFGRGETSQFVKQAAAVLDMEQLLNGMCLLFFTLFLLMSLMLLFTLRDENHLRQIAALKEQSEEIKTIALIQEQENRTYQEMQHLVHDLKSPLTAIQNLVGVMQYCCASPEQKKEREYLVAMENLVSNMSQMISEILYQDSQTLLTTATLLGVVRSQVSVSSYAQQVIVENQAPDSQIRVNRIRMARAIINLLNNAYNALPEGKGTIHLTISRNRVQDVPVVRLEVADDGKGIPAGTLPFIWKRGYSSHGSHGLGLAYVKSVVESSDGRVSIASQEETGTVVTIDLPEGGGTENEK